MRENESRSHVWLAYLSVPFAAVCVAAGLGQLASRAATGVAASVTGELAKADGPNLENAIEILRQTKTGHSLLERLEAKLGIKTQEELMVVFQLGDYSKTNAILTRHFNPVTGQEYRERRITIFVRKNQSLLNMILDIAHELTHAVSRSAWDPYDPDLTAGKYILATVEGEGGEVDALIGECRVSAELATQYDVKSARCKRYLTKTDNKITRQTISQDFYRVGHWYKEMRSKLALEAKTLPLLSDQAPELYSSTGGAPYPVALLKEFDEITRIACENSTRRLKTFVQNAIADRKVATEDKAKYAASRFLKLRCQGMSVALSPVSE